MPRDPIQRDEPGGVGPRPGRRVAHLFRKRPADPDPACAQGLRPVELVLVMSLQRRGKVRVSEISQEAGIQPGTAIAIVDRLERAALVRREGDRRDELIEATPIAAALADAVEASLMRHLQSGRPASSPEFASGVTRDLERIIRVLDEPGPPAAAGERAGTETEHAGDGAARSAELTVGDPPKVAAQALREALRQVLQRPWSRPSPEP